MTRQSFSSAFMVDQSSEEAFAAINNVRDWWPGRIEGATEELDAEYVSITGRPLQQATDHRVRLGQESRLASA